MQIPSEFIQRAIQEVQAQQQQQREQRKRSQQQRQNLLKISGGIIVILVLWNIWTYNYLSSAVERMRYNQAVTAYNQKIQGFPNSFLASVLDFQEKPFFKATKVEPANIPQP